jgi:hypothetical protein
MAFFPRELIERFFHRNTVAPPSAWMSGLSAALDYLEGLDREMNSLQKQMGVIRDYYLRVKRLEIENDALRKEMIHLQEVIHRLEGSYHIEPPRRVLDLGSDS